VAAFASPLVSMPPWHAFKSTATIRSLPPPLQIIGRDEARTASRKAGQMEGAAAHPAAPPIEAVPPKTVTAHV
jgi:hypothetical protein